MPLELFPALTNWTQPTSGLLDGTTKIAPLIQTTPSDPSLQRHFSAFALTSHLHSPVLRLVSLHPSLSVSVSFLRVPEIHDGFAWRCFFSRNTTVRDIIESVLDSLGLTKSLPVPGGGTVQYVLEEVWVEGDAGSESHVAISVLLTHLSSILYRGRDTFSGRNLLQFISHPRPPTVVLFESATFLPVFCPRRVVPSLTASLYVFHVPRTI